MRYKNEGILIDDKRILVGVQEYQELVLTVNSIRQLSTDFMSFVDYDYEFYAHVLLQSCLLLLRRFDDLNSSISNNIVN